MSVLDINKRRVRQAYEIWNTSNKINENLNKRINEKESAKFLSPIKVHQINLESGTISNREGYYDVIFSKSLIEHLNYPLKFIKNCKIIRYHNLL